MKHFNLYVTDWAPNGTNALLICNEDHEIVACIDEATFGIDVTKSDEYIFASDQAVVAFDPADDEYPCDEYVRVRQIDLDTLKRKLCVSPVDPDGARLIRRLVKAGIDLNSRGESK